jgi:hypothetical protein
MAARMPSFAALGFLASLLPLVSFADSRAVHSPSVSSWLRGRPAHPSRSAGLADFAASAGNTRSARFARTAGGGSEAASRSTHVSVSDGSGGLYITWADHRDGNWDIYLQRVTSTGAVASGWPAVGLAVCTAPGDQVQSILLPDGSNGALVGWVDYRDSWSIPDLYAQRVSSAGALIWNTNGVKVLATILPDGVGVAPDGTGGLLLAWSETGAVDEDIYATRYTSTGALASGWPVLVCDSPEDQLKPVITAGAAGGAIVAWEDRRVDLGSQTQVFAQGLDGAGAVQWATGGLRIDNSVLGPFEPDICPATGGGAFVFWTDLDGMVYGQRLDSAGQGQWTGGVNAGGAGMADGSLLIVPDGVDGVIAAWHESSMLNEGIRAQRVSGTGSRVWVDDGVSVMAAVSAFPDLVDVVADGGAYFVWQDSRSGFGNVDIYGQRVTATGTPSWGDSGIAICDASGFQSAPAAAYSVSGDLLVAWWDMRFTDTDIYAQRVSAVGVDQLADNGVAVFSDPGVQLGAPIFHTGDGGTIAFWHEKRNGQYDIRARKFDATSLPAGPAVDVCSAPGNQFMSALADDGSGGAIVCWTDLRGAAEDIYVQRVDGNAIPQWTTNGVAVCTAADRQQFAGMVTDMAGGAILAWRDDRDPGNSDIYAQRVNAAGTPVWTPNGKVVCADPGTQQGAVLASDGASGAVIAWARLSQLPIARDLRPAGR